MIIKQISLRRSMRSEEDREENPVLRRLCFLEQHLDLGPECAAGFPLVLGQFGQGRSVSNARQVRVGFPVLKGRHDGGPSLLPARLDLLGPERQVGLEPVDRLLSPAGLGPIPLNYNDPKYG